MTKQQVEAFSKLRKALIRALQDFDMATETCPKGGTFTIDGPDDTGIEPEEGDEPNISVSVFVTTSDGKTHSLEVALS
jgi:hypothetical protein